MSIFQKIIIGIFTIIGLVSIYSLITLVNIKEQELDLQKKQAAVTEEEHIDKLFSIYQNNIATCAAQAQKNKKDKDEELYRLMKLQNQVTSIESERLEINKVNVEPIHSYTYNNKLNINTNNNSANTLNKGQISNSQEINNTNYISVNVNLDLNEEASNQKRYVIDQNIKGLELKESPKKLQKKDKDQESNSKDKSPSKPNKIRIEDMN